ncbi:hypothetical protein [Paraburkholderia fynbosensis]|nr:hypothetical protein [Paraburkholderia fynbosensis]
MPGTIRMWTVKFRSRKIRSSIGRTVRESTNSRAGLDAADAGEAVFSLSEGAVLQQAITSTEELVKEAPPRYKDRVWLYRPEKRAVGRAGAVTSLTNATLAKAIRALIKRHNLLDDSGGVLRVNLSRTRKSYFDRAFCSTGDLEKTANLMGNTSRVAGSSYPSMNEAQKAEAAEFMSSDFTAMVRDRRGAPGNALASQRVIEVKPLQTTRGGALAVPMEPTPVSGCEDTLNGEHAPRDGHNHCDRYVMCLFCSSFAIVGTAEELWRLFSFQAFAEEELKHLESMLGSQRTDDDALEDLRDRYRIAIPYIDQFTQRQFSARIVKEARTKTKRGLHPFWTHQMTMSHRARTRMPIS